MHGVDQWAAPGRRLERLLEELRTTDVLSSSAATGRSCARSARWPRSTSRSSGINLGKVGFLSKAEAEDLDAASSGSCATGAYTLEERMALTGRDRAAAGGDADARSRRSTTSSWPAARSRASCRLDVAIDESHLATFIADGLVVSSPTGSTGYSFSAGGPILDPTSRNLVVTPIAGYLSAIRSVVVRPHQVVRCRVVDAYEALVSIDGREDLPLEVGDVVEVRALERPIRFVEPDGALPFWDLLRTKVQLLPS